MLKKNLFLAILLALLPLLLFVAAPALVHAQAQVVQQGLGGVGSQIGASGGTGLFSPTDSLVTIIGKIIKILLGVAGAIAVLFVVIGGFLYMTSAGNEEQAQKGRKDITNALIGIIIIILSYIIVSVIVNLVSGVGFFGGLF